MGFLLSALRPIASFALATSSYGVNRYYPLALLRSTGRCRIRAVTRLPAQKTTTDLPFYTTHDSFNDDIIDRYDAFILDQFGVLHNGVNALDGAVDLVDFLYQKKKKLIILSNTSAPASKALDKLPKFGFDKRHFQDAVTSGEESSRYILHTYGSSEAPKKALMFTWDASKPNNPRLTAPPEVYLERCGTVEVATSVEEADLLLFHGSEVWYRGTSEDSVSLMPFIEEGSFENVDSILKDCQEKGLPAVCANPDFIVQTPSGDGVAYMPGKLARRYEEMGGVCQTFGKPGVEHFDACIRKLGIDRSRVAHVGDSLHHDISGAVRAGIPNVFVTSGIHKSTLGTSFGELPSSSILEELMEQEAKDFRPTHVVPAFRL